MKKFLTISIIAILLFTPNAYAKNLKQGTYSVGGESNIGFHKVEYESSNQDSTEIGLDTTFGYFFSDNVELLASLLYSMEEQSRLEISMMGIGGGVTFHIPVEEKINYYLELMFGLMNVDYDYDRSQSDYDVDSNFISFGLGIEYFIKESISIGMGLEYMILNSKYKEDNHKSPSFETKSFGSVAGFKFYF